MEKSTDFVDIHPLTRLVHQGFGVLWLCENFRLKSSHLAGRLCAVGFPEPRDNPKGLSVLLAQTLAAFSCWL